MGRHANDKGGGNFTPAPVGTHIARCYKIIDIGTQETTYNNETRKRNQVLVFWELPTELFEHDGESKPFTVSKFYTNSLNEKANMRIDLQSWRGKAFTEEELQGFDLMNILGKPCMVTVIAGKKQGRVDVSNVTGLPKGFECPPQVNPSESFWIEEWDQKKFDAMSKGLQDLIKKSDEYQALQNGTAEPEARQVQSSPIEDDLPFAWVILPLMGVAYEVSQLVAM